MAADLTPGAGASFLYRSGKETDFFVPERREISVGYDRSNDVVVPFEGVSRRHARLFFDGKSYWIEDAGSANKTFLNGRRVAKKERLEHLDVVTLGRRADLIFLRKRAAPRRVMRRGIVKAWLEPLDGLDVGTRRDIPRGVLTIGRAPGNNVVADNQLVSKLHARLERTGTSLVLTDVQSANGTFVAGKRIQTQVLKSGDEFNLGGMRSYRVHIEEGEVETSEVGGARSPEPAVATTLPTDWKTRIEWSPEERAALDGILKSAVVARDGTFFRAAPSASARTGTNEPAVETPKEGAPPPEKAAHPPAPAAPAAPPPAKPAHAEAARPAAAPHPKPAAAEPPASAVPPPSPARPSPPDAAHDRVAKIPRSPAAPIAPPAAHEAPHKPPERAPERPLQTRPVEPSPAASPRVLLEGKIQTFPLAVGAHEVGRVAGVAVRIDTPQVSRRHALLRVSEQGVTLEDLGSSNGTFVNGERIRTAQALKDGDTVGFGDLLFKIRFCEPATR